MSQIANRDITAIAHKFKKKHSVFYFMYLNTSPSVFYFPATKHMFNKWLGISISNILILFSAKNPTTWNLSIDWLGQNMFISSKKARFFQEPISSAQLLFSSQLQWSISHISVDCSQYELELQNKKLIDHCKRKRMVPENDFHIHFIAAWRFQIICHYLLLQLATRLGLTCVIDQDINKEHH